MQITQQETLTLIVLSAQPVISRVPVISNVEQNTPASASNEPGCGISSIFWNAVPVSQSHMVIVPLSPNLKSVRTRQYDTTEKYRPPENNTPSALTDIVFIIAFWPLKLKTNAPSGHFHFLILFPPALAEAKEYSVG